MNYYNENDRNAAAWLRELIKRNLISEGVVDERSIVDVDGTDLAGFIQCHFFAGIGGWSYALRLAGWPDDRPVWTGSCPCQPFSAAGKRRGTKDPRHLAPQFLRLIGQCRPATVFGEQVASKDGRKWIAGVFAGLEKMAYSRAGADLCAAGVGAPHIRQRLYWVANAHPTGRGEQWGAEPVPSQHGPAEYAGENDRLAVAIQRGERGGNKPGLGTARPEMAQPENRADTSIQSSDGSEDVELGNATAKSPSERNKIKARISGPTNAVRNIGGLEIAECNGWEQRRPERTGEIGPSSFDRAGFWRDFDLVERPDIKKPGNRWFSRVKPGLPLLADGIPGRVAQLRGFGNAIVPQLAAEFIRAYLDT